MKQRRVLVAPFFGGGHVFPHLALAQALVEQGARVYFASEPAYAPFARMAGCTAVSAPPLVGDGLRIPERSAAYRKRWWGSLPKTMTIPLYELVRKHKVDLVVADAMHVAAALAAERAGVPLASLATAPGFMRVWFSPHPTHAQIPMGPIRKKLGLPPREGRYADQGLSTRLVVMPWLPELDLVPPPKGGVHVGTFGWDPPKAKTPRWVSQWTSKEPTILVTMTSMPMELDAFTAPFFRAAVEAVEKLSYRAIVTTAGASLPDDLVASPRVRVERLLPHGLVTPHVRAIVASAGWGILSRSLTAGVPLIPIPIPIGRDQEANADLCTRLGIGTPIPADELDGDRLASVLEKVTRARSPEAVAARAHARAIRKLRPAETAARAVLSM